VATVSAIAAEAAVADAAVAAVAVIIAVVVGIAVIAGGIVARRHPARLGKGAPRNQGCGGAGDEQCFLDGHHSLPKKVAPGAVAPFHKELCFTPEPYLNGLRRL